MPLTSRQKHYIKKNIDRVNLEKIASDLDISTKEILKYAKKQWGEKKYDKLLARMGKEPVSKLKQTIDISTFSLKRFLIDNANIFVLLFILIFVAYFNSLNNSFTSDDVGTFTSGGGPGDLSVLKNAPFSGLLRPIFYFIAFKLGGSVNPIFFRSINIFFHLGTTFVLFILAGIFFRRSTAIIIAAIFAVHPILIESVTWISGGPYSQYGFFLLLALLTYILGKKNPRFYYISIVSTVLMLMSNEKSVVLFVIIGLYEMAYGNLLSNWKKVLPYVILSFIVVILYFKGVSARINELNTTYYQDSSGLNNPLIQIPVAITSYLGLMFWPDKLTLYHTELTFSRAGYFFCLLVFLAFLSVIAYGWKKNKHIFFWLSFFFIILAPTLTPLKVAWIVAERYVYLGTIGVIVVFALLFDRLANENEGRYKKIFYGVMAAIVVSLSIRTIVRNVDWKNEDNLWVATGKVAPSGAPIHNNLGDVYARHNDYPKAIEEFTRATQINPGYADAYHNLANTYQMAGDPENAQKYYEKALSINPRIWQSHQNLAAILFDKGDKQGAIEHIKAAIEINPGNPDLQKNLQIITGSPAPAQ